MAKGYDWSKLPELGSRLLVLNSDRYKESLSSYLQKQNDEPGAWFLHSETDLGYARQLVAEARIEEQDKLGRLRKKFKRFYKYNHLFDCEVYQIGAISALNIDLEFDPYSKPVQVKEETVLRRDGRGFWDR